MNCASERFTLPTVYFVGGGTEELIIHTYGRNTKREFNLTGCDCQFALMEYTSKDSKIGTPLFSKTMSVDYGTEKGVYSIMRVTLLPEDTVELHGKFIYQISIRDIYSDLEPPQQGIFYIYNNIDKSFVVE